MSSKAFDHGPRKPGRTILIAVALAAGLAVQTATAEMRPVSAQAAAPQLVLQTDNGPIDLSQLRGQVVYVDFWASWCGPCRKSFPWLNDMQARYGKDGLKIVAINLDKDRAQAERFLEDYAPRFTIAFDPQANSARAFVVKGMPSSYLIDRNGNVVHAHVGFRKKDTEAMEARIRSLLQH